MFLSQACTSLLLNKKIVKFGYYIALAGLIQLFDLTDMSEEGSHLTRL